MLKTEGDISGGYREKLDQPIVHGWGVEACCPAFPLPEPVQVPGLWWQRKNTSRQSQQNFFHQNKVVRIDWPVRSSDMSTIENVKDIFGQSARCIILASRNLQALKAVIHKESRLIHRYQITGIKKLMHKTSTRPNLWLTGTHVLLKAFSSSKPDI